MGKSKVQTLLTRYIYSPRKDKNFFKKMCHEKEIDEAMNARREENEPIEEAVPMEEEVEVEPENHELVREQEQENPNTLWDNIKSLFNEMYKFLFRATIAGLIAAPTAYFVQNETGLPFLPVVGAVGMLVASIALAMRIK